MNRLSFSIVPLILLSGFLWKPVTDDGMNEEKMLDGPYVFYRGEQVVAKYIVWNGKAKTVKTDSLPVSQKENFILKVPTDQPGKFFTVKLQKKLQNEKSDFKKTDKKIVISDIEGNFEAFRKLLQANNVIDANFKWIFGEGHLVTIGDFFDRGDQVTEVLWLIYSLEEQARAAGGYVHFVLGNHEIMNLSDDLRYLNEKYKQTAQLLNLHYMTLYDENTELGRWLRTKNIVERIGRILFMHAGISAAINRMDVTINRINQLARPYYADTTYNYKFPETDTIMGNDGPFWYRGYFSKSKPAPDEQIDNTLSKFAVKHIVVGHSLVADTVSLWYGGKVINTDTHHAKGHSEALLVEASKFYRVNAKGDKVLLMER